MFRWLFGPKKEEDDDGPVEEYLSPEEKLKLSRQERIDYERELRGKRPPTIDHGPSTIPR